MTAASLCPDELTFEQLRLCRLSLEDVEQVARHLEQCDRCAGRVQALHLDETLVEALRGEDTLGDHGDQDVVSGLIQHFQKLRLPADPGTESSWATDGFEPQAPPGSATEESFLFLSPAQGPDEIGRLGPYRLLKVLGQGGMGAVFLAEDLALRRLVAVKAMLPSLAASATARERFFREARAAAALKHDHVVTIHQVGEDRGVPFLTMELLEGESLDDRLKREEKLPAAEVLRIGRELAEGLHAAHARGLIHRDVKPGNVWLEARPGEPGGLSPRYRVKVLDFGLARGSGDASVTASGAILGTPAYMAPEQARGEAVDVRSDLFSLGVVLYRMTTGQLPFKGKDAMSTLMALALETPSAPHEINPEVPKALSGFIQELMAKDPAARPVSAAVVAKVLETMEKRFMASPAPTAPKAIPVARPAAPPKGDNPLADLTETNVPAGYVSVPALRVAGGARRRRVGLAVAVALAVILLPVGYFYGTTILNFATDKGQVVIEVDDPGIEVTIKEKNAVISDAKGKRVITLKAGEKDLEITVKEANGDVLSISRQFTLTRGGKKVLDVRQELATRPKPPNPKDPLIDKPGEKEPAVVVTDERSAAKWALSMGGWIKVRVAGGEQEAHAIKDLPAGTFQVTSVSLKNTQVSDTGLAHLKAMKNLMWLDLDNSRVSDAGLVQLKTLTNLTTLGLARTRVGDAGLAHLKSLTKLTRLVLNHTQVSDAGLVHLKSLTNLMELNLVDTQVTDAGLSHLKSLTNLTHLDLLNTRVSDAGLAHLKSLTKLTGLGLGATQVGDAGLAHLKMLTKLSYLDLGNTHVSDVALTHLKTLTKLSYLDLGNTRISDAGMVHFGTLTNLTCLLVGCTHVSDAGLANLKTLTNLLRLNLDASRVSDTGLAHLKTLTKLSELGLNGTRVSDAGSEQLVTLSPTLQQLGLQNARVSSKGIATLKAALPHVKFTWSERNCTAAEAVLVLGGTVQIRAEGEAVDQLVKTAADLPSKYFRVTRVRLVGVKMPLGDICSKLGVLTDPEFDGLRELAVADTPFGNGDLQALSGLTSLPELSLTRTAVSDAGLAHLKGWTGLQRLILDGLLIKGFGLLRLKALPKLTELSLAGAQINDAELSSLKELKQLRRLVLDGNPLLGSGLANVKELTELTELRLGCPRLTDVFASNLAELKSLKHLEKLSLAGSGISDDALKHLHGLTGLSELDLTGTKVTAAGVAALQKALPKCKIRHGAAGK